MQVSEWLFENLEGKSGKKVWKEGLEKSTDVTRDTKAFNSIKDGGLASFTCCLPWVHGYRQREIEMRRKPRSLLCHI